MIGFDNSPANGDYVRYIDDLVKRAAINAAAGAPPMVDVSEAGSARERMAAIAAARSGMQQTGFVAPTAQQTGAARAAAVASALMSGEMAGRSTVSMQTKLALAALPLGLLLILVGVFLTPFNLLLAGGGGALLFWSFNTFKDAAVRASAKARRT